MPLLWRLRLLVISSKWKYLYKKLNTTRLMTNNNNNVILDSHATLFPKRPQRPFFFTCYLIISYLFEISQPFSLSPYLKLQRYRNSPSLCISEFNLTLAYKLIGCTGWFFIVVVVVLFLFFFCKTVC